MEAQGAMALHEAYKTYDDERILDGLWGLGDYFAHHVIYFPKLGLLNNRTSMPNDLLGYEGSLTPHFHDHYIQALPILYYYSGWQELQERYLGILKGNPDQYIPDNFRQFGIWQQENAKRSTRPPAPITDLRVTSASRQGIALSWTSPADDGPGGRATRYFVKYSDKPITDFAATDNPARAKDMARIVAETDTVVQARAEGGKLGKNDVTVAQGDVSLEAAGTQTWHPDWFRVNSFWMAEHVAGEPQPGPAGSREQFTLTRLRPHGWFGVADPGLDVLKPGTWYIAIASWDEDRNLSRVSNVVSFELK
jgi:hypothetical protein